MRIACALIALFACIMLRAESAEEGMVVKTPTSTGVILKPSMISEEALKYLGYSAEDVTFWTPSRTLILNAEKKLSAIQNKVHETDALIPPGGFHLKEYYTPKYNSRNRSSQVPPYAYTSEYEIYSFYSMDSYVAPSHVRQYLGVVIHGRPELVVNFVENTPRNSNWKTVWVGGWGLCFEVEFDLVTPTSFSPVAVKDD
jgi:hypothetical protein